MTFEFTVVSLVVMKVDKRVCDDSISTIIKLSADLISIVDSESFDYNDDRIVNNRMSIIRNRNRLRKFSITYKFIISELKSIDLKDLSCINIIYTIKERVIILWILRKNTQGGNEWYRSDINCIQ